MPGAFKRLLIGASVFTCVSTISSASSFAATIVSEPYTWTLETENDVAYAAINDNRRTGTRINKSDTLGVSFVIGFMHTPPESFIERLDPLPSSVPLNVTARFMGTLLNTTFKTAQTDSFARATASLSAPGGFPLFPSQQIDGRTPMGPPILTEYNVKRNRLFPVSTGNTLISGGVDVDTLFGEIGSTGSGSMTASASLDVSGKLIKPKGFIRYKVPTVPVPEPSSVLGVLAFGAFGAGTLLKRQVKNRKLATLDKSSV